MVSGRKSIAQSGLFWPRPWLCRVTLVLLTLLAGREAGAQTIRQIEIRGNRALEEETIRSLIVSSEGELYSPERVTEDIHALYASGFIRDVVVEKHYSKGPLLTGIILVYIVTEKPLVHDVTFEGTKTINEEELETIADMKPRSVYDPAKVQDIRKKLLEEYARKGYFMARVEVEVVEVGPNQVDVIFFVEEGKKPTVKDVKFFGNKKIPSRKLRRRMSTKKESVFSSMKYSQEDFERDQYILDFYYEDNGYLEAAFAESERLLTEDRRHVILGLGIEEGPQYRVGAIGIQGDMLVPEEELKSGFLLITGEIFRKSLFMKDQQYLLDRYGEEGYALCEVVPELDLDREKLIVNLVWHIRKGSKVYVEKIVVSGNDKTYDKVIRRELAIKEGQLYSTAGARKSEARVQRLGYFEEVQLIPRPGSEPNRINLDVAVKEKRSGSLTAGAGVSTVSEYFFSFQYQQENFLGRGLSLSAQAMLSEQTQTFYFRYADPYFIDSRWHLGFDLFSSESYYIDFIDKRQGGSVTLGRKIPHLEYVRFYTTYSYLITNLESFEDTASIYRKQPSDTAIGSLALKLDRNALNNYIDPTDGSRITGEIIFAGQGLFGGDNDFIKTRIEGRFFQPVYKNTYIGTRARARWMSYDGGDRLLITERYFQGGSRSLRGYEVAAVSPLFPEDSGELTPIGGNKDILFTIEYIVPISEQLGIKMAFFADAGNVFNDNQDMAFDDLLYDYGVGLRWMSPMGPLRFEMAYPVDPREDDDSQQFIFSMGTIF